MTSSSSISSRIRYLRERRELSQEALSEQVGFKDRQTLSSIENGHRKVDAAEVVAIARALGVKVSYFTDPFELAGEGRFSWRQRDVAPEDLDAYENKAGRWLAAYRHLARQLGRSVNSKMLRVALDKKSSFEEAVAEGDAVARALELGDVPAQRLSHVLEELLGTLVLYVDTEPGISGAACQLSQLNCVLINRGEPQARQAYDLAHELFHLLTWEQMPPQRIEGDIPDASHKRVEQLAENFASGLLMPTAVMERMLRAEPLPAEEETYSRWIAAHADRLEVSASAMMWRLVNMGVISVAAAKRLSEHGLIAGSSRRQPKPVARFSRVFVQVLHGALTDGLISVRRTAEVLQMPIEDLAELFVEHRLDAPFDL